MVFLLTNPGGVIDCQKRDFIAAGNSPMSGAQTYGEVASAMGRYYETKLPGAAGTRVAAMMTLAGMLGYSGVLQVDSCPIHSSRLPMARKLGIVDMARQESGFMRDYADQVTAYLELRPVVAVTAAGSRRSLTDEEVLPAWPAWVASLMGLDPPKTDWHAISDKISGGAGKVTSAVRVGCIGDAPKVMIRMMGSNNLPAEDRFQDLTEIIVADVQRSMGLVPIRNRSPLAAPKSHMLDTDLVIEPDPFEPES